MSVFNEIKRNVTNAATAASKKTTELTGLAKLNMNIKLEQSKLSECYEEIGRLFYTAERKGEDNTSDIAARIMQADKIKANIAKYQADIARLKKIVICENCNAEMNENAVFCSTCGTKLEKKPVEAETPCDCGCGCEEAETPCDCGCGCEEAETPCDCGCGCEEAETPCDCGCGCEEAETPCDCGCGCAEEKDEAAE